MDNFVTHKIRHICKCGGNNNVRFRSVQGIPTSFRRFSDTQIIKFNYRFNSDKRLKRKCKFTFN